MPLETDYINPDVILTTRETQNLKDMIKYVNCGGLILLTFFLSAYAFGTAIWWLILTGGLWWGALWYLKRRPTIVLEGRTRKIQLSGITKFAKAQTLPFNLVEKVTVMADILGRARGQYIPQLVLKSLKGGGKKLVINCFPVEDIVQAHYTAQLLATFCRTDALDYKKNQLPILPTHIPTRFRAGRGEALKSVATSMKKAKTQKKGAGAPRPSAPRARA
jgi:hypothetical protein